MLLDIEEIMKIHAKNLAMGTRVYAGSRTMIEPFKGLDLGNHSCITTMQLSINSQSA